MVTNGSEAESALTSVERILGYTSLQEEGQGIPKDRKPSPKEHPVLKVCCSFPPCASPQSAFSSLLLVSRLFFFI